MTTLDAPATPDLLGGDRAVTMLDPDEVSLLAECEATIEGGLDSFIKVGLALASVRDGRLYRAQYGSFETYLARRWDMSRSRAHRLIEAADVVQALPIGNRPTNEAQARELAKVPEGQREAVWQEAGERTDGKPTAAAVEKVRRGREEPSRPNASDRPAGPVAPTPDPRAGTASGVRGPENRPGTRPARRNLRGRAQYHYIDGAALRRLRLARNLKQTTIAAQCGLHRSTITRLENGIQPQVSGPHYVLLCQALGLPPCEWLVLLAVAGTSLRPSPREDMAE